jgi:hypothetical protein
MSGITGNFVFTFHTSGPECRFHVGGNMGALGGIVSMRSRVGISLFGDVHCLDEPEILTFELVLE